MMPAEKSANAVSVMAPSIMLISERGFGRILNETMAESPAKKKAAEDTAPCARVKSLVKMPTPIAPIAIKSSIMFRIFWLWLCLWRIVAASMSNPRVKTDALKIMAEGPTPRSLM